MIDLPDVHFGPIGDPPTDSTLLSDEDDPVDEELDETPADVIAILGFDPKELSEASMCDLPQQNVNQHSENSSYREKLIEHLFVSEMLKISWLHDDCSLEVAKPEVDNSGYDLIMESRGIVRHIQLKASILGGKTKSQKIHTKLAAKPSGCVVWIYFDKSTMLFDHFRYFGAKKAGDPLPSIKEHEIAKHTKGNKDGEKTDRQNIRVLPNKDFMPFDSIEGIYAQLFKIPA